MAHVLILTLVFPPDSVSTADIVGELALDLRARGHEVTVVTTTPHYNLDDQARAQQPLTHLWPWGPLVQRSRFGDIPVYHVMVPPKGKSVSLRLLAWVLFHIMSTVVAVFLVRRPNLILAPSPPLTIGVNAWIIGLLKRTPFVYNVQEIYPDIAIRLGALRNRSLIWLLLKLEQFVYGRARRITVVGPGMRQRLLEKGVADRKIDVIANGVETLDCVPAPRDNPLANKLGLNGRFVVTYAGNMGPTMGLETVIDAASRLRDCDDVRVLLVGGGMLAEQLRAEAERRQLGNVVFLPRQPYTVVPEIYGMSDVCLVLQAAGTASDVLPSKVYRIMAFGRPIIAAADADSDLTRLIRASGCGEVVAAGDPEALACAIRAAREHAGQWAARGSAGREYVDRHYSRSETSAQYDTLIRAIAGA